MAVAAAGLTPISPFTKVIPVVEIPALVRIEKLPAPPRVGRIGPIPAPATGPPEAKIAVMFLFAFTVNVKGFVDPLASPLQPVNE